MMRLSHLCDLYLGCQTETDRDDNQSDNVSDVGGFFLVQAVNVEVGISQWNHYKDHYFLPITCGKRTSIEKH